MKVRYVDDLGAHLIKSVTLTYGSTTLARYKYCQNCKELYGVSEVSNIEEEFDKLYKGIHQDTPKDWCWSCLEISRFRNDVAESKEISRDTSHKPDQPDLDMGREVEEMIEDLLEVVNCRMEDVD